MNYFSKKNIVIVVIAVLLIVNVATVSTIVYHSYDNKKVEKFEPERKYSKSFRHDLNFTAEQMKSFTELKVKFREQTRTPLVEMHKMRMDLIKEMSSADPDTAKMFAMADDIGGLHAQIKRSTIEHFLILKNTTTTEQFEGFLKMFRHSLMDDDFGRWSRGQGQSRRSKGKRPERNKY